MEVFCKNFNGVYFMKYVSSQIEYVMDTGSKKVYSDKYSMCSSYFRLYL